MSQTLMIVAGEHSGDVYGGGFARAFRARAGAAVFCCGGGATRAGGAGTPGGMRAVFLVGLSHDVSRPLRASPSLYRGLEE